MGLSKYDGYLDPVPEARSVNKYAISTTMRFTEWDNSKVLTVDLLDKVRVPKDHPGTNLGVTGSIGVCHDLIVVCSNFLAFPPPRSVYSQRRRAPGLIDE